MDFYQKLKEVNENVSFTENGMEGLKSTNHSLVDFNFKISSYRFMTEREILSDFKKILSTEDSEYALRLLFMIRDINEGFGERRLFRVCLEELINYDFKNKDQIIDEIMKLIPEYGRFDDLFIFIETPYEKKLCQYLLTVLTNDVDNANKNKPISLLAKWMPSENASSDKTKKMAKIIRQNWHYDARSYRKLLSKLRAYLDITERKMSANQWAEINYNTVPSKANLIYRNAFMMHDTERRSQYYRDLANGVEGVKMNAEINFPHDITSRYNIFGVYENNYNVDVDETLENAWKNLKDIRGLNDTIVVRDGSGSMFSPIGNSNVMAIDVANAITIYCSERLNSEFKNKFITFSSEAELVELKNDLLLKDKLLAVARYNDCSNTNLEKVFDLILKTAVKSNMSQSDFPSQVMIVSDMEFDPASDNFDTNVVNAAKKKFSKYGYKLPKLIFWNVNSRSGTIPCAENENGVLLVSGFSVNTINMILSGETDMNKIIHDSLNSKRYEQVPLIEDIKLSL